MPGVEIYTIDLINKNLNSDIDSLVLRGEGRIQVNKEMRCQTMRTSALKEALPTDRTVIDGDSRGPYEIDAS